MNVRRHTCLALVLFVILVGACDGGGDDDKPGVTILSPPDQHDVAPGETLQIESRARDDGSIDRVELHVEGLLRNTVSAPANEKSFRAVQSWLPPGPGTYHVAVIAYDGRGQASEPAKITIVVRPAPTTVPAVTLTPPPPTSEPSDLGPGGCTYDATFVTDVTIPDDTELAPGTEFVKTWRLRNSGTCDWGPGFQFVFVEGERMGGPATVGVQPTLSGATVDVSVPLQAPQEPGSYRGRWRMRTPDGRDFGSRPFVRIVVPPPATATPLVTPTATAAPRPDLDITLVSGNLELLVGQPLTLRVTVHNHGPGATDRPAVVQAILRVGLQIEGSLPTLPAGGQEVVLLSHTFDEPAELGALVSVDPGDEIAEEDETNNRERVPILINPPLYTTHTITVTPGLSFDLDDGAVEADRLDVEWQVVEGTTYLGLRNGAGAALLSGEAESVSYVLVAGLVWQTDRLALADLTEGILFGFRTSEGRVGYARVEAVLDVARTSARLACWVWDWP
jgi:hypothetical protein